MRTYKHFIALIIALAMPHCVLFAQAPVKRIPGTTNVTTSTPANKPTPKPTKPSTNAASANKPTSHLKRSQPSGYVNGHMAVDLGLSVRWADCNVGANSPEQFGQYFAFGDPTGTKYIGDMNYRCPTGKISGSEYDMAYKNWGGHWRLPTSEEIKELRLRCTWQETYVNGIKGYLVTSTNGNSIFFPYAGYTNEPGKAHFYSGDEEGQQSFHWLGRYWIGDAPTSDLRRGNSLELDSSKPWGSSSPVFNGASVRAVTE